MTIVKVQVPITTNDRERAWLVYDKNRARMRFIPEAAVPASLRAAMGADLKGYFDAEWKDGNWVIGSRAADRGW